MVRVSIILFSFFLLPLLHANTTDSLFKELDQHFANQHSYTQQKELGIRKLTSALSDAKQTNNTELLYFLYSQLANEYQAYNYDSAISYSIKRLAIAYNLKDKTKIAFSKSEAAFVLVRRGHYHEAIDSLKSINSEDLSLDLKAKHYGNCARAFYDLADYNMDYIFSPGYRNTAEKYVDSVISISPENSWLSQWYNGLKYLARYDLNKSVVVYENLVKKTDISTAQKARVNSALGYIYLEYKIPEKAKEHIINSAILDLKSSTKESMALTSLAEQLYAEGDIEKAYKYILVAKQDADMFGAKLRQLAIAQLLPKIEAQQLRLAERKRKLILQSVKIIGTSLLIFLSLLVFSLYQVAKLKKAKKTILRNNKELLTLTEKLREANKIKIQYIGYYFSFSTRYLDKLENLKSLIKSFIKTKNTDAINRTVNSIDLSEERENLFKDFDKYFLDIFPLYIEKFNSLLEPDKAITVESPKTLNKELRIFALIRLGIKDNDTIAKILGLSVNTIYTYKTKIKKSSKYSNSEFDQKLMEIRSV